MRWILHQNPFVGSQNPLSELTALPQTPLAGLGGGDGARGGKEWEWIRDNGEQGFIYIALGGYTPPVV